MCDGGSENHASTVVKLLLNTDQSELTKLIAQQDIIFSNSPAEGINKILKSYLRRLKPQGVAATMAAIRLALNNYTHVRSHGSIDGLIPRERYLDPCASRTTAFSAA